MAANETFISTGVFEAAFWLYVASVIPYILDLALRRDVLHKTANRIFQLAFVVHSIAFMLRWGEAGLVEVKAFETAEGAALVGAEWLRLFLSHPPWSNLYESLVCFAWGAAFVGMVGIERFRLQGVVGSLVSIAGVALIDVRTWHWLYDHPNVTPAQLRDATPTIPR